MTTLSLTVASEPMIESDMNIINAPNAIIDIRMKIAVWFGPMLSVSFTPP